ncbi:acetyl-CoA C-acetyltransferase [Streptomyces ipomoeae]|uniref:acetyl-CoA C-acetyltransferase n=1 Tax=Streptomyces ipomoeae TaxID=103232 RepID=UPI0011470B8F|nr:acetyl-CoA C-acetyltransferase [Streptomyces ipomoeae]MDX2937943.1 acetyl-CoA C-acetyltransferase [Streptomyces ipomoeae]TQE18316.1 acetyl-CoA C-acetyltransferase [Streptomyces ipomoeae]
MGDINEAFVYDVLRTPRGRGRAGGSLHGVKPVSLVAGLLDEVGARHPGFGPLRVDDVILGVVSPIGDQGANLARTAALATGYESSGAGFQLNRFCGSGLEAVNTAAQKVRSGWEDFVLAGGVESMSRVPMGADGGPALMDAETAYDTSFVPQGISADLIATLEGFSREDVDAFAAESHARAVRAVAAGAFGRSLVAVRDVNGHTVLDHDEVVRPGTDAAVLAGLEPSFAAIGEQGDFDAVAVQKYHWIERIDHVHTAGNSSTLADGAALTVVGSERAGRDLGLTPRARIAATATVAGEPTIMLTGPAPAARKALAKAGLVVGDIDLWEVNEAFAAVVLRFLRDLDVPHEKVNVNGGAIALGHPLGATGVMLLGTLLDELERRDLRYGLATICTGGGMGVATVIERI